MGAGSHWSTRHPRGPPDQRSLGLCGEVRAATPSLIMMFLASRGQRCMEMSKLHPHTYHCSQDTECSYSCYPQQQSKAVLSFLLVPQTLISCHFPQGNSPLYILPEDSETPNSGGLEGTEASGTFCPTCNKHIPIQVPTQPRS